MTSPSPHPRPRRGRRLVAGLALLAVVALAVGAVVSLRGDDGTRYRTAAAEVRSVDETLALVATIEPVSQATVAFPVAGTVASVDVEVGDEVAVGQGLAGLDTEALADAVDTAQAAYDDAVWTLERALDGEDVSSGGAGSGSGGVTAEPAASTSEATVRLIATTTTDATSDLRAAQQAVLDAQQVVSEVERRAAARLEAAEAACDLHAAATDPVDPDAATDADDATVDTDACRTALAEALGAQQELAAAQDDLVTAATALTDLLADASTGSTGDGEAGAGGNGGNGGNGGSAGSGGGTASGGASGPTGGDAGAATPGSASSSPTAEELIAFQKTVDQAAADLLVAENAVDQARITTPIAGTVVEVGLEVGADVDAASTTQRIVVVGDGGMEATVMVGVDDLRDIEVGQPVVVAPDGGGDEVEGEVVAIGVAPDDASTTTAYVVTVGLIDAPSDLGNGSLATVRVVTDRAEDVLTVPTSAVHVDGDRTTVTVLTDGGTEEVTVDVGAIGSTWTEIGSGLDAGATVVVADLDAVLPGDATESSSGTGTDGTGGTPEGGGAPPGFTGGR